jgi:dihydroorotate dehydrogenase electron transfer subunit
MIVNSSISQALSRVISTGEIMPGTCLIWLESPQIASVVKPGQFVMVRCGEDTLLRRPFSIHQVNEDKTCLAFLFSVVGEGTQWLSECRTGDTLDLLGPLGNSFSITPDSRNILLVAGGIGIAPLYFLTQEALREKHLVKLLYGTADNKRLSISPKIELVSATEDGSVGYKGMITDLLPEYIDWADQVFACGPSSMYRAMSKMPEIKDKSIQISLEVRMGCGLGICYGCTVKTRQGLKQVCKDGPIFELGDILWDEFVDI